MILKVKDNNGNWIEVPALIGNGISKIEKTAGTSNPGSTDTYTITYTDGNTFSFNVYNGKDGDGSGDMLISVYDKNNNGIVDNAEKVNGHTVAADVPSNAKFTDTTYSAGTGIEIENGVISNTQTSANWGNITGTLNSQTDLKNALDGKANSSHTHTANEVPSEVFIAIKDTTTYAEIMAAYNAGKVVYMKYYDEYIGYLTYVDDNECQFLCVYGYEDTIDNWDVFDYWIVTVDTNNQWNIIYNRLYEEEDLDRDTNFDWGIEIPLEIEI